jgi:hypothetical protein
VPITATLTVRSNLHLEFGERVDCRVEDCVVLAESFGGDRSDRTPITFGAPGPVSASPSFTG